MNTFQVEEMKLLIDVAKNVACRFRAIRRMAERQRHRQVWRPDTIAEKIEYGFTAFQPHLRTAKDVRGKSILEIGAGANIVTGLLFSAWGAKKVVLLDKKALSIPVWVWRELTRRLQRRLSQEQVKRLTSAVCVRSGALALSGPGFRYVACDGIESNQLALRERFDFIYSHAVLEHIHDLDGCLKNIRALLTPGGTTSHVIDLKDHRCAKEPLLRFLCYSDRTWLLMTDRRTVFSNRLRLGDYRQKFERASFHIKEMIVLRGCSREYVESLRPRLDERFKELPAEELQALVIHLVATLA